MHEEFFNERWRHVTRGQCIYKRKTEDINVSTSGAKGTIFYFTIIFNYLDEKFRKRSDFISLMKVLEIFWERCGCLYNINIFPRKGNIFFNNYDTTSNNVKMVLYHKDFLILLLDPETITEKRKSETKIFAWINLKKFFKSKILNIPEWITGKTLKRSNKHTLKTLANQISRCNALKNTF